MWPEEVRMDGDILRHETKTVGFLGSGKLREAHNKNKKSMIDPAYCNKVRDVMSLRLRWGSQSGLGDTILDEIFQLNKLSLELFLSWSVNAVILKAAESQASAATSGITALNISPPSSQATASPSHFTPYSPLRFLAWSVSCFLLCLSYGNSLHSVSEYFIWTQPSLGSPPTCVVIKASLGTSLLAGISHWKSWRILLRQNRSSCIFLSSCVILKSKLLYCPSLCENPKCYQVI